MWTKKIRSTARSAPGSTSVALPLGSSASDGCSSQLASARSAHASTSCSAQLDGLVPTRRSSFMEALLVLRPT
jgi:hypothetical protein